MALNIIYFVSQPNYISPEGNILTLSASIIDTTNDHWSVSNLEGKDVDGALVRGAAQPLVPAAEVDAVDSRLKLNIL